MAVVNLVDLSKHQYMSIVEMALTGLRKKRFRKAVKQAAKNWDRRGPVRIPLSELQAEDNTPPEKEPAEYTGDVAEFLREYLAFYRPDGEDDDAGITSNHTLMELLEALEEDSREDVAILIRRMVDLRNLNHGDTIATFLELCDPPRPASGNAVSPAETD